METTRIQTNDLKFTIETLKEAAKNLDYVVNGAGDACSELAEKLYVDYLCKVYLTNAPRDYDYDYTVELEINCQSPIIPSAKGWRKVAILKSHADYQTARYASGLYVAQEVKE